MKNSILLLLFTLCAFCLKGQDNAKAVSNMVGQALELSKGFNLYAPTSSRLFPGNTSISSKYPQIVGLLNKDVMQYYDLRSTYDTELKRKVFFESAEKQKLQKQVDSIYNEIKGTVFFSFLPLSRNNTYNLQTKSFDIEYATEESGKYINVNGIYLTIPNEVSIHATTSYGATRYNIRIPIKNEATALDIENSIDNCSILFLFDLDRVIKPKNTSVIAGRAIYACVVNRRTGEIYAEQPIKIPSHISERSVRKYPIDKSVLYGQDETLNTFISNLKEVVTQKDTLKIRDFLGGRPLEMFDSKPKYYDWEDEYYGSELHKKNTAAWDNILKAIEPGGAKEDSDRGLYIFPWYEVGFDKYLGTWNNRTERFDNQLVDMFSACAVIGDNINVRSAPNANSSVVGKLSWQVVARDTEYYESVIGETDWVKVSTLDNMTHGFISSKFLFAPWTTRVIVGKVDDQWKIVGFRTCD